jgi:hypothetical protein
MPIPIACTCGTQLDAPDHLTGRTIRCRHCHRMHQVPSAPVEEVYDAPDEEEVYEFAAPPPPAPAAPVNAGRRRAARRAVSEYGRRRRSEPGCWTYVENGARVMFGLMCFFGATFLVQELRRGDPGPATLTLDISFIVVGLLGEAVLGMYWLSGGPGHAFRGGPGRQLAVAGGLVVAFPIPVGCAGLAALLSRSAENNGHITKEGYERLRDRLAKETVTLDEAEAVFGKAKPATPQDWRRATGSTSDAPGAGALRAKRGQTLYRWKDNNRWVFALVDDRTRQVVALDNKVPPN